MEIIGVSFLSHNNNSRMQGRRLKGAGIPEPQWGPWPASLWTSGCVRWVTPLLEPSLANCSVACDQTQSWLRVERWSWNLSPNLPNSTCSLHLCSMPWHIWGKRCANGEEICPNMTREGSASSWYPVAPTSRFSTWIATLKGAIQLGIAALSMLEANSATCLGDGGASRHWFGFQNLPGAVPFFWLLPRPSNFHVCLRKFYEIRTWITEATASISIWTRWSFHSGWQKEIFFARCFRKPVALI